MVLTVRAEMFPVVQAGHLPQEAAASIARRGSPHATRSVHAPFRGDTNQGFSTPLVFYLTE